MQEESGGEDGETRRSTPSDDEDDEGLSDAEIAKKEEYETSRVTRVLNGMMDTVLRGSGVYGAVVSVVKNTILI